MQSSGRRDTPIASAMEVLEVRFDAMGLSTEDLIHLLNSGLDLAELLEYTEAIAAQRIH
jgi:hypothetical protein